MSMMADKSPMKPLRPVGGLETLGMAEMGKDKANGAVEMLHIGQGNFPEP